MPKSLNGQSRAKYDGDFLRAHQTNEGEERNYSNPHRRYYEEKFARRRSGNRGGFIFIVFGLSLSALVALASIMFLSLITSISG